MENKNFFKDIYDDFFGIEKLKKENEKLLKDFGITDDFSTIKIKKNEQTIVKEKNVSQEELKEQKDNKMVEFFERIEKLYVSEESKNILKKIIEYVRKYNEKIVKQYIPFNMCVYSDNTETIHDITDIMSDALTYFSYVKQGDIIETSFYNIESKDQIEEIYNSQNTIILFKDFESFISQEQTFKDKFLYNLQEKVIENKTLTILSAQNKEMLNQAFEKNEDILRNLFNFEINSIQPNIQDVYNELIEKLKENCEITDNAQISLLDYVSVTYLNSDVSLPEYRDNLCNKILFSKDEKIEVKDIPVYEKDKTIDEIFEELNSLVGLKKVKVVLQDLVNLIELKNKTKDDLKIKDTNLHMVFLGNPGTGKTTVARIIAQILYNLKYIKQNKLIEVSCKDLVAEYVGQTAPKTMAVIEKAMGGVLFIDEAYSLASGNGQGNSFNEEAIATLIQAMENYRDDLVVIFAGYTKEMQAFLDSNSGVVSRIGYTLEFEDYSEDELLQIFESMMKKSGFEIEEEALNKVKDIIKEYKGTKNFGNARFVRNVYEKSIIKHASNTKGKKSKKILRTITEKDINVENLLKCD